MGFAGARLAFGGKPLQGHSIPDCYGAIQPTAVFVPLEEAVKEEHFEAVTTEVFGPFQVSCRDSVMYPKVYGSHPTNAHCYFREWSPIVISCHV